MENQIEVIEKTALTWPEKAASLKIIDQGTYDQAANTLIEIAEMEKKIKAHHEPIKTAAHNAHKAAVAAEKRFLDPLTEAKGIIRRSISTWETEQRRIAQEAQRKAQEEARKREEEERLARAEAAEKEGKSAEVVEKILDTPAKVAPVVVQPTFEQNSRVTTRDTWKAEVTDIVELCKAVGEGKVLPSAVLPNMPFLNTAVRTMKGNFTMPGVKAVKDTTVVTR